MSETTARTPGVTRALAAHAASIRFEALPEDAVERARHCLVDWFGVALAGSRTAFGRVAAEEALAEEAAPRATVLGAARRAGALGAALANGTAGHALDFDDVHPSMRGHPTVAVLPAVLAEAEAGGARGADALAAFVAGLDVACRVGDYMGDAHYERGFHATGTVGTLGAAAGVANLRGLDADATARALGIAASQSAGLKAAFGTPCKPLHAGKAAMNGLLAARLAARGFDARDDVLEYPQGLADVGGGARDAEAALAGIGADLHVRRVLFKYHAACYGTHAAIEAVTALRAEHGLDPDSVRRVTVHVPRRNMKMCTIPSPRSGLEGKFSLAYTIALTLAGRDTSVESSFTDAAVRDPAITPVLPRVTVECGEDLPRASATVTLDLADGTRLERFASVLEPEPDLARQRARLEAKCRRLAEPVVGGDALARLLAALGEVERLDSLASLLEPCRPARAEAA